MRNPSPALSVLIACAVMANAAVESTDVLRKFFEVVRRMLRRIWEMLPAARLRQERISDRERTEALEARAAQQLHESARRVHVLEWREFMRRGGDTSQDRAEDARQRLDARVDVLRRGE